MLEHWEKKARDGAISVIRAKKERGEAKQEARVAPLVVVVAGDTKAGVEVDLTKALNSLSAVKEGKHRSKAEIAFLEDEFAHVEAERASLLLELKASKREVSSLHA